MNRLLNYSLRRFMLYAAIVLVVSIPAYFTAISLLWQYELDEHNIELTPAAGKEDSLLIIGAVTSLTVIFFVFLLGGFILINRRISRQLWQPFYNSLKRIREFDLDSQVQVAFEKTTIAEFVELNDSLDKLLSANITAYRQQKEFADNASHELQTPLAIAQSKMEILLQHESMTSEQYSHVEDAMKALSRVSRINKNLLLLTKLENSQYGDKEIINLSSCIEATLLMFAGYVDDKQITLSTEIAQNVQIEGNRVLVELVIQNLLNNSIRHSSSQSTVQIRLDQNTFEIQNPGNSALDKEHLFKRFAKANTQSPGTGLGLALVKQICTRYGWNIQYFFKDRQHVFCLQF